MAARKAHSSEAQAASSSKVTVSWSSGQGPVPYKGHGAWSVRGTSGAGSVVTRGKPSAFLQGVGNRRTEHTVWACIVSAVGKSRPVSVSPALAWAGGPVSNPAPLWMAVRQGTLCMGCNCTACTPTTECREHNRTIPAPNPRDTCDNLPKFIRARPAAQNRGIQEGLHSRQQRAASCNNRRAHAGTE